MRGYFRGRGWAAALCALLLAACAGPAVHRELPFPDAAPQAHLITGLPFHPQIEDQCGPASLATVLGYWGQSVDPESLRGVLYIPDKGGAVTTEMVARARRHGFLAFQLQPELAAVLAEVAAGNPVLVLQNLSYEFLPMWHYSIVIGYDSKRQLVLLRSGNELVQEVPVALFTTTWKRAGRWARVIVPPDRIPASATAASFLAAASDLEVTGSTAAALQAYQAAIARWPQAAPALFGAGNTAYRLGDYVQASDYLRQFIAARPQSGPGWNNLAYALEASGCVRAAHEALRCAVALAPGNPDYADGLAGLPPVTAADAVNCAIPRCAVQ